jgi:hypothetical protein
MTPVEAKKKIKMMKTEEFRQLLHIAIKWLHEIRLEEPPASAEEYAQVTEEAIQHLYSQCSEVMPKKVVKVRQVDLEDAIRLAKEESGKMERFKAGTQNNYKSDIV